MPAGARVAVIGPSGAGKSSLLRLLAGLEAPTAGRIVLDGTVVSGPAEVMVPPQRRHISMVFQDLALWPNLSAVGNVMLALSGSDLPTSVRRLRALETLEQVGVRDLAKRFPETLSGGEQQRVALARALAPAPKHLFLDEPFASIDLPLKSRLLAEIARLADQQHLTIVLVTHDPLEALTLCNDAIVLERGRVAERGQLENLLAAPAQRSETLCAFANQLRALKPIRWAAAQRSDETA
jgi:iron(III) transport system ATP-binding protein